MIKVKLLVELTLDETHPSAITPDQVMDELQDHLTNQDSESVGIQIQTVSVMPYPLQA